MSKIFGVLGLLAGVGVLLLIEVPVLRGTENPRRYAAVYGTILTLFWLISMLQILQKA